MLRAGRTQSVKWTTEGAVKGLKVQEGNTAVLSIFRKKAEYSATSATRQMAGIC